MQLNTNSTIENNTGFEAKSFSMEQTPHFFKILSSSLYEDKVKAVLRELSANALDAHIDVGKKDIPIHISLPNELSPELVVSDYGKGMSLETLEHIYTSYGASTKTHSNKEIGGFGMGSKSPFALTQSFTVESTHEGITTHVACYLDEGMPKFSVFSSTYTGNNSGTTVKVPVSDKKHIEAFADRASTLFVLWETPPEIKGARVVSALKDHKVHEQDSYLALDHSANINHYTHTRIYYEHSLSKVNYLSIGPFIYSIPDTLKRELQDNKFYETIISFRNNGEPVQFIPKFSIGDLELAPSRERIEVTEDNKKRIIEKLEAIVNEVTTANKDITPQDVYYEALQYFEKNAVTKDNYHSLKNNINIPKYLHIDTEKFNTFLHTLIGCQDNPIALDYHFRSLKDSAENLRNMKKDNQNSKINHIIELASDLPEKYRRNHFFYKKDSLYSYFQSLKKPKRLDDRILVSLPILGNIRVLKSDIAMKTFLDTFEVFQPVETKSSYTHKNVYYNTQLETAEQFIILKGHKKALTTSKINKLFRQDILHNHNNTVIIYTKDLDPKLVVEDIKKFHLITKEKDRSFYFQSDIDELSKKLVKITNKRASVDRVKKEKNLIGKQYKFDNSSKYISELDMYHTDILNNYKYFVYADAQNSFVFHRSTSSLFKEDMFSDVFFFTPSYNREFSTKRFQNLLNKLEKQGKKVIKLDVPSNIVGMHEVLRHLIKTNPKKFKLYVKEAVEKYTQQEYLSLAGQYLNDGETQKLNSLLYGMDTTWYNLPVLPSVYDRLVTDLLKKFIKSELKESLYSKYVGYLVLAYRARDLEYTPEEVFTKQELKKLTSTFHKTTKKAGKLYDSSFENLHGIDCNTF